MLGPKTVLNQTKSLRLVLNVGSVADEPNLGEYVGAVRPSESEITVHRFLRISISYQTVLNSFLDLVLHTLAGVRPNYYATYIHSQTGNFS